ncbi:MAG: hypothetical protein RXQ80_05810 [Sulfolobaceae archaeon]
MWVLEDPVRLINRTADVRLREPAKMPWLRVYGPFKNSRLADWTIFYSSFIFIQLFEIHDLLNWWIQFLSTVFLKYTFITIGIVLFYGIGELWRRKLQFKNVTDNQKLAIISVMTIGGLMIISRGITIYAGKADSLRSPSNQVSDNFFRSRSHNRPITREIEV